jgi:ABC-type uncharacterized transport system ATPase component
MSDPTDVPRGAPGTLAGVSESVRHQVAGSNLPSVAAVRINEEEIRTAAIATARRARELARAVVDAYMPAFEAMTASLREALAVSLRPATSPQPGPRRGRPEAQERALAARQARNTGPARNPHRHRGL